MPIVKCKKCGRQTNTAISTGRDRYDKDGQADTCYAAFVDGKWEKGCDYDNAGYLKVTVDDMIRRKEGA